MTNEEIIDAIERLQATLSHAESTMRQPAKYIAEAQARADKAVEALRKRTWVGLTDEEIKAFDTWHDNREEEIGWVNPSEIVAYIEAKLKEKNT
jgi:hypothetical protein